MIFKEKKELSLYYFIAIAFFIALSFMMAIQTTYNYMYTKKQLNNEVKNDVDVSSLQLKKSLIPFIESYDVTQYQQLIKSALMYNNLLAIELEDFVSGKIIGKKVYTTSYFKDNKLKKIRFEEKSFDKKQISKLIDYKRTTEILDKKGEKIAKLSVYGTNCFVKKELKNIIFTNILVTIFIYTIIFYLLYLLIKRKLVIPIRNIINFMNGTKAYLDSSYKINEHSSKELSILSTSINSMIDEIKKSNKKIEEANLRWQFAVEGSGDGLWDWNLDTNEVFFSKKYKSMLGYSDEEIEANISAWERIVHPDDIKRVYKDINEHINGNVKIYQNEHRIKCKDGTYKWILDKGIVVKKDKTGKAIRFLGTQTDITKRKEYEKDMKQALTVFENTHDGILITNSKNEIINANQAFCDATGYNLEDIQSKKPSILKSSLHDDIFYKKMWDSINNKGFWIGEITNKRKDGSLFEEYLTINTIKNGEKIENYIGIFSDISILKHQEKMLLQQARASAAGEMLGNIAHQWRQPLSVISTAASGLKLRMDLGEKIDEEALGKTLDTINDHTQHLSKTIEDFRNFFRGDMSKNTLFDVSKVVQKVNELTKDSFKNSFVEKIIDVDKDIYIKGNENLLLQCLLNIYNNSLDALKELDLEERRLFFVSLKQESSKVVLTFKDNAKGIKEENLEKIFEPYFTTKHKSVGTGLGLYMTHQIITKQFLGKIVAKNYTFSYENKKYIGMLFKITI